MRDSEIFNSFTQQRQRIARIYKQMIFVDTRMQAFEQYIMGGLLHKIVFLFWPSTAQQTIDRIQLRLMQEHDDALRKAVEKPTSKLSIVTPNGVEERTIG